MTMVIKIILDLIPDNNTVLTTISASSSETEIAKHKKHGLALEGTLSEVRLLSLEQFFSHHPKVITPTIVPNIKSTVWLWILRSYIFHILDIDYLDSSDHQHIHHCDIVEIAMQASRRSMDVRVGLTSL